MSAYALCKKFITAKTLTKYSIETRVNAFFMFGQLTEPEYTELMELIKTTYTD